MFMSVPGLKIVCPSSPAEAYGMLKSAIRDNDPVLVIEHKALLSSKGQVALGSDRLEPLSGPRVLRPGRDATVVASLAMVPRALAAAEKLAAEGIAAEVIDIRALRPMNLAPVIESVRRTNNLVTVEEQAQVGGWGAEVVAQVTAEAFDDLDSPPRRVTLPDHPVPYSPPLEDSVLPSPESIAAAVKSLL